MENKLSKVTKNNYCQLHFFGIGFFELASHLKRFSISLFILTLKPKL